MAQFDQEWLTIPVDLFLITPSHFPSLTAASFRRVFCYIRSILFDHRSHPTIARGLCPCQRPCRQGSSPRDPLKTVADALETAVKAAKDGAADAKQRSKRHFPPRAVFYPGLSTPRRYTLSYGVVFPAVLIAKSIPTNNAVVHGMVDGARAAGDMVDQMKTSSTGTACRATRLASRIE